MNESPLELTHYAEVVEREIRDRILDLQYDRATNLSRVANYLRRQVAKIAAEPDTRAEFIKGTAIQPMQITYPGNSVSLGNTTVTQSNTTITVTGALWMEGYGEDGFEREFQERYGPARFVKLAEQNPFDKPQ